MHFFTLSICRKEQKQDSSKMDLEGLANTLLRTLLLYWARDHMSIFPKIIPFIVTGVKKKTQKIWRNLTLILLKVHIIATVSSLFAHDKSQHYSLRNLADTCVPARTQRADNKPWAMGQLECLVESQNSSDSEEASGPGGISVRKSNQSAKTPPTMARCNKAVHCSSDSNVTSLGQYKKKQQGFSNET